MKLICCEKVESLEVGELYKVQSVKKISNLIFYKVIVQVDGVWQTKWIDSKKFKYPMKWKK